VTLSLIPAWTRARTLGLAAFGFAKFLSPFPKRLKSPHGEEIAIVP